MILTPASIYDILRSTSKYLRYTVLRQKGLSFVPGYERTTTCCIKRTYTHTYARVMECKFNSHAYRVSYIHFITKRKSEIKQKIFKKVFRNSSWNRKAAKRERDSRPPKFATFYILEFHTESKIIFHSSFEIFVWAIIKNGYTRSLSYQKRVHSKIK